MRLQATRAMTAICALLTLAGLTPKSLLAERYVQTADPAHPKAKYSDSLVSLNDRCIVAGNRLNLKVRPVYVSGAPIGFC